MDWLKKHTDTVIVLGGILSSVFWMNHKFTEIDNRFVSAEKEIARMKSTFDLRFSEIDKDLAVMKAVLMVKGQFPKELMSAREDK